MSKKENSDGVKRGKSKGLFRKLKNIKDAQKLDKWQYELKELMESREAEHEGTLKQNEALQKENIELQEKLDRHDLRIDEARLEERKKADVLKADIKRLEGVIADRDKIIKEHEEGIHERKTFKDLRDRVNTLDRENISLAQKLQFEEQLNKKLKGQVEDYKQKLADTLELVKQDEFLKIPVKDLTDPEKETQQRSLKESFYRLSELPKEERLILKTAGNFREYKVKDLKGRPIKVLMDKPFNETAEHFALQSQIYRAALKHTAAVEMYLTGRADVEVHIKNGTKIAFEAETGTQLKSGVKDFEKDKLPMLEKNYSDFYFVVPQAALKKKYERFGKTIGAHQVEELLEELLDNERVRHGPGN